MFYNFNIVKLKGSFHLYRKREKITAYGLLTLFSFKAAAFLD